MSAAARTLQVPLEQGRAAFVGALDRLVADARELDDHRLLGATRCHGWVAVDLCAHVLLGLQEMLRGFVHPTADRATTDAAGYWTGAPGADDPHDEVDAAVYVRRYAAANRRPSGLVSQLLDVADAVRYAAVALGPGRVRFQGHVLAAGDFLATWAVELAVHHLDLQVGRPHPVALELARRTVLALAADDTDRADGGADGVPDWPDERLVLLGTGRASPTAAERTRAPELVRRLPVLS